jgi:hypothetical protein
MAEYVAAFHLGNDAIKNMQVRPADRASGYLVTASRGCSIFGSGTDSHLMSPLPCHANAFIGQPSALCQRCYRTFL